MHIRMKGKEPRSLKCIFIGYPQGINGYMLWVRDRRCFKTIISRDVIFNKSNFLCLLNINPATGSKEISTNPTSNISTHI